MDKANNLADGLGFNNPSTLAKLWSSQYLQYPPDAPWWLRTSDFLNATIGGESIINGTFANGSIAEPLIHDVLDNNMTHAVYTVSIASILGSIAMIMMINHFDRKDMLTGTFVILGFVLIIVCASFKALFHQGAKHIVLIVFWIVISFLFQFGPNSKSKSLREADRIACADRYQIQLLHLSYAKFVDVSRGQAC